MNKLVSSEESVQHFLQHSEPCSDCPWRRDSLKGWLGGNTVQEWLHFAHSDVRIPCHVISNQQCAGSAIYRRNTCKSVLPPLLVLEKNHQAVFSNRLEFEAHHNKPKERSQCKTS